MRSRAGLNATATLILASRGRNRCILARVRKAYRNSVITIRDVARAAGVTPSTVSKALNGTDRVGQGTRERVCAVAKKLGWHANQMARGLVLRRSHLIGLVVPSITNDFCAQLYQGAESYAVERGYGVLLSVTKEDLRKEKSALERLRRVVQAEGVIALPAPSSPGKSSFHDQALADWPYVLVVRHFPDLQSDRVLCDDVKGGYMATSHLIALGHRTIFFVSDARQSGCSNVKARCTGYRQALGQAGLRLDPACSIDVHIGRPPEAQTALFKALRRRKPTAIFANNDPTAVAILAFLNSAKLKVPDDIALVGFGNLNVSRLVNPQLTTIDYGAEEMGRLAATVLIDRLQGSVTGQHQILLEPHLVSRDSCGARSSGADRSTGHLELMSVG